MAGVQVKRAGVQGGRAGVQVKKAGVGGKRAGIGARRAGVGGQRKRRQDLEREARELLRQLALSKMDRRKQTELDRYHLGFGDEFDSEYWCCLVFQTREQKEAFLKAIGHNIEESDKYVSGTALAKRLGVKLPPSPKWKPAQTPREEWAELALPLEP